MPTIRSRGDYWQVMIRLKGYGNFYRRQPKKRGDHEGLTYKQVKLWAENEEAKIRTNRAYAETPALARELQKGFTFQNLIDNYRAKIIETEAQELSRPGSVYVYGKQRKRTYKNEGIMISRFEKDMKVFCHKPLDTIVDGRDIQEYIDTRLASGKKLSSVLRMLRPIRYIWKQEGRALRLKLPDIFSTEHLQYDNRSADIPRERYLLREEEPYLFKAIEEGLRGKKRQRLWLVYVLTALSTAMRRGELLTIKWKDYNPTNQTIELSGNITKNKQRRLVPVTENLAYWLRKYRDTLSDKEKEPDARIFPLTETGAEQRWTKIIKLATKLSNGRYKFWSKEDKECRVTLHSLKHTALTRFAHKPYQFTDRERSYFGAHKGFRQTDRYEHINLTESIREKLELVDEIYDKAEDYRAESLADIAFDRQFNTEPPASQFPDLDWIVKDGQLVIDGPRSSVYLAKLAQEEENYIKEHWERFALQEALNIAIQQSLSQEETNRLVRKTKARYKKQYAPNELTWVDDVLNR